MQFFRQHRTVISLMAPLVAFFLLGSLVPAVGPVFSAAAESDSPSMYLSLVVVRTVVMIAIIAFYWRTYPTLSEDSGSFRFHVDRWGILTGVVGAAAWIGLCELGWEAHILSAVGLGEDVGERAGVNPFEDYTGGELWLFLLFRFALLVVAVPIAEELFLRGFFMRAVDAANWEDMSLTEIGRTGLMAGTLYGVLSHPGEFIAAAVWFTLVTFLMLRTNKFWNCVVAHAVTNLILGVYVCLSGSWYLW